MSNLIPSSPEDFGREVRFTEDGFISVLDGIRFVIGCSKDTAKKNWQRLQEEHPDVVTKCHHVQFPDTRGRLNKETPVADLQVFLEIVVILPGKLAAKVREEAVRTLIRAMNGDATLAEEIIEKINNPEDLKRIEARARGKLKRLAFTSTLQQHGVTPGFPYAHCTNQTYKGLYGKNASGLRVQKGLKPKANVRDSMNTQELIEVAFAEEMIDRRINKLHPYGHIACGSVCIDTASKVAKFMSDLLD